MTVKATLIEGGGDLLSNLFPMFLMQVVFIYTHYKIIQRLDDFLLW